ncbi:acyl-CoA dehydrogenase family protein [Sporichthya brevicatena]|uniref:Acyl-CoA dehydrogenase family protein n=1 Tax=Sporichthya brevicatena TaxID=171442 RepID=A0ABN1GQY8_9ACTN
MHYGLTEEQTSLREMVAKLLADLADRRERYDAELPVDVPSPREAKVWAALVESGVAALGVPEALGGPGGDAIDQVVVAEELGAALARVPFGSAALASVVLGSAPDEALTARVLEGRPPAVVLPGDTVVLDAAEADAGLVFTGGALVELAGEEWAAARRAQPCVDRTRSIATVTIPAGAGRVLLNDAAALLDEVRWRRQVLLAAESTGVARWCLDTASAYARTRQQFGVPIGTFQAVKHSLADMLVRAENARSATWGGAWALAHGWRDRALSAAMAKAVATENARAVAAAAVQIHGGIGVTWEHDLHLYLRRAKVNEQLGGTPAEHFAALAGLLLDDAPSGASA